MKDHKQTHSATDLLIVCTCVNNRVIVVWVPCSWCCKGAAIDCISLKVRASTYTMNSSCVATTAYHWMSNKFLPYLFPFDLGET